MDFSWFWKRPAPKPILPLSVQDLEGDLVEISSQVEEFVMVSTGAATEEDIESPKESDFQELTSIQVTPLTPLAPVVDERLENLAKQNSRKERWERQYRRIFATVSDARGEVFEVRYVNQNRQLAFWDPHLNTQSYVYPRKNSEQLETKEKSVLTIVR